MRFVVYIIVLLISLKWTRIEGCTHPPDELYTTQFVSVETEFQLNRSTSDSLDGSTLYMIYEWDVVQRRRFVYDGFLYKFLDRDSKEMEDGETFRDSFKIDYDPNACVGLNSTLWYKKDEDTDPVQCTIPCKEYFPPVCNYSKVCSYLREGYKILRPDTKRLELPVQYGRIYDLSLMVYRNWHTGENYFLGGRELVPYCKHELIISQNISNDEAYDFCGDKMNFPESARLSGPPAHFEKYKVTRDLETNRGTVTFRWKEPYDMSPNATLEGFHLYVGNGKVPVRNIKPKTPGRRSDDYYNTTIEGIEFGRIAYILVSPMLDEPNCTRMCGGYGFGEKDYFKVEDINGCAHGITLEGYCDDKAKCIDLPSNSSAPANCTCPEGYGGNGISTKFENGTGCYDNYDACSLSNENHTCDHDALCFDWPPPYRNASCRCPTFYIGDGYRSGTGCSHRNLIIGLAVGIPLLVILLVLIGCILWRSKRTPKPRSNRFHDEDL
ncbi:uncharacterized protein LOC120331370 [Styela clava]